MLRYHILVTELAGEMERGVTLPHLWCYVATFMLLAWLARWNVGLHCHIYVTELVDEIECDVTLPHCRY